MSSEMHYFAWSILLGLVYLLLALAALVLQHGLRYVASPRDETRTINGKAARLAGASRNYVETFPFYAATVLLTVLSAMHNDKTLLGSQLYFWARVVYLPVYFFGIPYLRTGVWTVSIVGIVLIICGASR
jgi:uncharacterized MAPEG superfamily protein